MLSTPRQQHGPGIRSQLPAHLLHNAVKVRAEAVHLVDERDARHTIAVGLTPDGFALRLHTADAAEHGDSAIQHAQRALHLRGEVHVAGRVDDIEPVRLSGEQARQPLRRPLRPGTGRGGRGDGDAFVFLDVGEVRGGVAVMHISTRMDGPCVEEDAFGQRGFASINVGRDAQVADAATVIQKSLHTQSELAIANALLPGAKNEKTLMRLAASGLPGIAANLTMSSML